MIFLKKKNKSKGVFDHLGKFLLLFSSSVLFFLKAKSGLDPDFGWHWRMGEIILTSGIPKTDPFSYTMPSFPFVDHEWLTNVGMYWGERKLGYDFLALVFALLGVLSLVVSLRGFKEKGILGKYELGLWVLGVGCFGNFLGVRPQVLSWFYLAIFLKIILKEKYSKKDIFWISVLMLVWVNTHGSFALGIFCLGVVAGVRFLKTKGKDWRGILVFLGCLGLSLVNPYKARVWEEVWRQVSDRELRWRIEEWSPSLTYPVFPFLFLVAFFILVCKYWKKFPCEELILGGFFLIWSFSSLRNIPLFVVFCLPLYLRIGEEVLEERLAEESKEKIVKGFFWLALGLVIFDFLSLSILEREKGLKYPVGAVEFLSQNLPEGRVFSSYDWGGYLIWKLPEKRVFIDGRMPSWRRKDTPLGESSNAMEEFLEMLEDEKKFREAIGRYQIKTVVWETPKGLKNEKTSWEGKWWFWKKKGVIVHNFLINEGWKVVYQDEVATIYIKTE